MYPDAPPDPRPVPMTYGVLPVFWIVGLIVAFLIALTVSLGSLYLAVTAGPPELEVWGVIAPDEGIVAVHDQSPDGTSGCVITGPRLVRWDDRETTGSVTLKGATVEVADGGVEAHQPSPPADVFCPFGPGEDAEGFAALARRWTH